MLQFKQLIWTKFIRTKNGHSIPILRRRIETPLHFPTLKRPENRIKMLYCKANEEEEWGEEVESRKERIRTHQGKHF